MDIYILDGTNGPVGIIDTFESCIWTVQYWGKSDFQLILPGTEENVNRLKAGTMLVRDMDLTATAANNVMMVTGQRLDWDADKGWTLTVTGAGLKMMLGKRIIWRQTTINGKIESGIRKIIKENAVSPSDAARQLPDLVLGISLGLTETSDLQLMGENIGDWLPEICETYGIGWDISIRDGKYTFLLTRGTDRTYDQDDVDPVVFSPDYDNLAAASYTEEQAGSFNAALVGGEGEGASKRSASIGNASGFDRREVYIDGSSVSSNGKIIIEETYQKLLEDYGKEQLAAQAQKTSVDGEIIPNGMYQLGQDYDLGDLVQIDAGRGVTAKARITEILYSMDDTGETIIPKFEIVEE